MAFIPALVRPERTDAGTVVRLCHPLVDAYLELVGARARLNTLLGVARDLRAFFSVVAKEPVEVARPACSPFITAQRSPRRGAEVVRIEDGEAGLSARTIKGHLTSIAGLVLPGPPGARGGAPAPGRGPGFASADAAS